MTKVAGFLTLVAVFFGLAFLGGRVFGPDDAATATPEHGHGAGDEAGHGHGDHADGGTTAAGPGALQQTESGYTLELADTEASAGRRAVSFTITGPGGRPVTAYETEHEKRLHLIAVRRDLTGFQHVHPTRHGGTWTVPLDLTPGVWRVIADFTPAGGPALTLGTDLGVAGDYRPQPLPDTDRTDTVDGFEVSLAGDLEPGRTTTMTLTVSRNGRPVTDLQPYLGAYGHLVMLRAGDLGYVHVHPEEGEPQPGISFMTQTPSAGAYRLFLDFKHGGVVRTAEFTIHVGGGHEH